MRAGNAVRALGMAVVLMAAPIIVAAQANTPVVAVLYFDNNSFGKDRGDFDGLGKGIADLLITDMATNPSMRVVERDRIQSILQEQALVSAKSVDPQTAVRLGKLLGAQYMITGGFMSDSKGTLLLTSRVINVETGAITNPVKLTNKGDDVLGLIGQLSQKLNTELKLPAPALRTGEVDLKKQQGVTAKPEQAGRPAATEHAAAKPQKLDVKTALLYSKALDEQDSGNSKKAAELYRAVLQKFPDFSPAQQNLAKVQRSGD